jgi:hypothetical protein
MAPVTISVGKAGVQFDSLGKELYRFVQVPRADEPQTLPVVKFSVIAHSFFTKRINEWKYVNLL